MRLFKFAAAGAMAVSLVAATGASAAQSASSAAALAVPAAPVNGVRSAAPIKHASKQSEGGSAFLGYGLAAVVLGGVVAATIAGTDKNSDYPPATPASPG
jgi:hypothetical protein